MIFGRFVTLCVMGSKMDWLNYLRKGWPQRYQPKLFSFSKSNLKKWKKEMKVSKFLGEYHQKYGSHWTETSHPFTNHDTHYCLLQHSHYVEWIDY
jgi:hypothetical protein